MGVTDHIHHNVIGSVYHHLTQLGEGNNSQVKVIKLDQRLKLIQPNQRLELVQPKQRV